MTSPTTALLWEIWRRHRNRLLAIVIVIFAFALFYPKFCGVFGVDLNSPNALDGITSTASDRFKNASPLSRVFLVLSLLFLLLGPLGCMIVSLLYVIWIFSFAQLDSRKGFAFPARLFTLPVSANFLASWFLGVGVACLVLVYLGWTFLVRLPRIEVFDGYPNCLAWVTLLVVAQAIIWGLDAFPVSRVLLLCAALSAFCFMTGPALRDHPFLARNQSVILFSFLALGGIFAFAGLNKIRQGAWQRCPWKWRLPSFTGRAAILPLPGERAGVRENFERPRFPSPTRAQFWFEWRAHAGKLFLYVCGLSGAALLAMSVVAVSMGSLSEGDTFGLTLYLLAVPLFIHLVQGIAPQRNLPPFIATLPLTSGDIVMAKLTTAALSAILSWLVTLVMLCVVPLLGDVPTMLAHLPLVASYPIRLRPLLPVIVLGLVFLSWRFIAADICLGWAGNVWAPRLAVAKIYSVIALAAVLSFLARKPGFDEKLLPILPFLLAFLVMAKLVLAQWAFHAALKRQLLARSAMLKYLAAWLALALVLIAPSLALLHREPLILSLVLGVILLLPLARIGFSPLALSRARHR